MHNKQRETLMEMRDYFIMEEGQMNAKFDEFADDYDVKRKAY